MQVHHCFVQLAFDDTLCVNVKEIPALMQRFSGNKLSDKAIGDIEGELFKVRVYLTWC